MMRAVLVGLAFIMPFSAALAKERPIDPSLDQSGRALLEAVMEIVEAECPPLARVGYWRALPDPGADPRWMVEPISAEVYAPPGQGWDSAPAPVPDWRVGVSVMHDVQRDGPTVAILAGGPDDPGLLVRSGGGYLGAQECGLTEGRPGGYSFRSVPALAEPLRKLLP